MEKQSIIIIGIIFVGLVFIIGGFLFQYITSDETICKKTCQSYNMNLTQPILKDKDLLYCECTSKEQKYLIVEAKI